MVDQQEWQGEAAAWHRPRDHADETRFRIIQAALQLIADHGFAATSTREIAERLGFTKAALYYHFRTKAELLAAIVQPAMEELVALVATGPTSPGPVERRHVVERYVDLVAQHASLIKVLMDDPSVRRSEALGGAAPHFRRLVQILSGTDSPDTAQRARVRGALGAVHAILVRAEPDDEPAVLRELAVSAALGVLGLQGARRTRPAAKMN